MRYAKDMPMHDYEVITKDGKFPIKEIHPREAIMEWVKGTSIRAGQKQLTKVSDGYWFAVLIDEKDDPFDCWVRQV